MAKDEGTEILRLREAMRFTQLEMAERLSVPLNRYKNWEYARSQTPPKILAEAKRLYATEAPRSEVGAPMGAISETEVPVPYIGKIAASTPVDWSDPLEAPLLEPVPVHMMTQKGVFTARVGGDSMMPLLMPEDLCIFVAREEAPPGLIVLYMQTEVEDGRELNTATIKQLKHDGTRYVLHALNPTVPDVFASGRVIGVLTGYVREIGRRRITDFDPDGIRV